MRHSSASTMPPFLGVSLLIASGFCASATVAAEPSVQTLTRVQLVGFASHAEGERVAAEIRAEGIDTLVMSSSGEAGYFVSAGVFARGENAERMDARLRALGYSNLQSVSLASTGRVLPQAQDEREKGPRHGLRTLQSNGGLPTPVSPRAVAADDGGTVDPKEGAGPVPVRAAPGSASGDRVLILGSPPEDLAQVLDLGSPGPPPKPAVPDAGDGYGTGRISVDQLRTEAGFLPRSGARADGSHYLHGTVSAQWPVGERWSARLAARADGYIQTGDDDFEEVDLDYGESYLRYRDPDRRVTLGAQTVLWGQVDELPPTDQLSVQDATRFVLDDLEDRRRAVLAARWEEFVGEYKLDVLYVPFFRAAEMPEAESVWSPVDRSRGRIAGLPADPLMAPLVRNGGFTDDDDGRGGWGVRLSRAGRGLDYAVTLQDARRSLPYYELNPQVRETLLADPTDVAGALAAAPDTFIARHPRTWVVGGDVGFATEQATWRFEAAWLSDRPATTGDLRLIELEAVEWVAGADFFPGDGDLRVTLQVGGSHLLDAPDGLLDREDSFNLYGDVENSFAQDRWRARLRFFQGLDERDTYLNPSLSFVGWEPHEITLGYHYFDGSDKTLGGFYKDNDIITLGWRARF